MLATSKKKVALKSEKKTFLFLLINSNKGIYTKLNELESESDIVPQSGHDFSYK